MLRPIRDETLRSHMHRSGWPFAMSVLEPLCDDKAPVVFDDFIEKTFYNKRGNCQGVSYTEPWVGVCHHPPDAPFWAEAEHLCLLKGLDAWNESVKHLRLCVTLEDTLASWVRRELNIPCVSLRHPTEIPDLRWSPDRFLANHSRMLLQVGWYLRNMNAIFQADVQSFLAKAWLRQTSPEIVQYQRLCRAHGRLGRHNTGQVLELAAVSNLEYDHLLSENVVFVELFAAAANNTVIECIARNTPIVINRLPGPEYYLGPEYPLFYENFDNLRDLITVDRLVAAHEYLLAMNKEWLDGRVFRAQLREACVRYVPELQDK